MPVTSHANAGPERHVCDLLRQLSGSYEHLGHAFAAQRGIYSTDFRALLLVEQRQQSGEQLTAGELAAGLGLSSGAVTYLVERLVRSGHLQREEDPSDRRKVLLGCTARGRDVARAFADPVMAAVNTSLDGLEPEQVARVRRVITVLIDALGDQAAMIDEQERMRAIA